MFLHGEVVTAKLMNDIAMYIQTAHKYNTNYDHDIARYLAYSIAIRLCLHQII